LRLIADSGYLVQACDATTGAMKYVSLLHKK